MQSSSGAILADRAHPTKDLIIAGAGGLAREVAVLAETVSAAGNQEPWHLLGFVDRHRSRVGERCGRWSIIGDDVHIQEYPGSICVVAAIGFPADLARVNSFLAALPNVSRPVLVHPAAVVDCQSVSMGDGCVVSAGVVVTTDVVIGSGCILNLQCTLGHDACVGRDTVINVGAKVSGRVRIGDRCLLGSGAVVLQDVRIGDDAVVGAGAVVTKDVPAGATVAGVPARVISREDSRIGQ